jgi:hypothetical protein
MNHCHKSILFALGLGAWLAFPATAAADLTYGGRAFGILISQPLTMDTTVCDTGNLPPGGGSSSESVNDSTVPAADDTVRATTVACSTSGGGGMANSAAEIELVQLSLHGDEMSSMVTASFVRAETEASCSSTPGTSTILDLNVDGTPVTVSGSPNQQVIIPGVGTLTINEQIFAPGKVTVNALHFVLLDAVEMIIASAYSEIVGCTAVPVAQTSWGGIKSRYRE